MVSTIQNYTILFVGGVISIVAPSILVILLLSDSSFMEILQHIYSKKIIVLSLSVLSSIMSKMDDNRLFLLGENILPGALIGVGIGFLIFQTVLESN